MLNLQRSAVTSDVASLAMLLESCFPFDELRANGSCIETIDDFPFVLSLSKHVDAFCSGLLKSPDHVQADKVNVVSGVMALQGAGQRTAPQIGDVRAPAVEKFVSEADRGGFAYRILQAGAEAQVAVQRQDRGAVEFGHRRAVIREPRGEEHGGGDAVLHADSPVPRVMKVRIADETLTRGIRADGDINLTELFPVLPAEVAHNRE